MSVVTLCSRCFRQYIPAMKLIINLLNPSHNFNDKISQFNFTTNMAVTNNRNILICGLGNLDITQTRHSVGMLLVDHIVKSLDLTWSKKKHLNCLLTQKTVEFKSDDLIIINILFAKPTLPMNVNGSSVAKIVAEYGIKHQDVFLINDELDKSVGKYSIKEGGSARGHNGLKSVYQHLKTNSICHLLIGIDRPDNSDMIIDHVLGNWTPSERDVLMKCINNMATLLWRRIGQNFEGLNNNLNLNWFEDAVHSES